MRRLVIITTLATLALITSARAVTTEEASKIIGFAVLNSIAEDNSKTIGFAVLWDAIEANSKTVGFAVLCTPPGVGTCPVNPSKGGGTAKGVPF